MTHTHRVLQNILLTLLILTSFFGRRYSSYSYSLVFTGHAYSRTHTHGPLSTALLILTHASVSFLTLVQAIVDIVCEFRSVDTSSLDSCWFCRFYSPQIYQCLLQTTEERCLPCKAYNYYRLLSSLLTQSTNEEQKKSDSHFRR